MVRLTLDTANYQIINFNTKKCLSTEFFFVFSGKLTRTSNLKKLYYIAKYDQIWL